MSKRGVSRSTIFPFPSSPHCPPIKMMLAIVSSPAASPVRRSAGTIPDAPSGDNTRAARRRVVTSRSAMDTVLLDGEHLTLLQLEHVARGTARVDLDGAARRRMADSRAALERVARSGEPVYGMNTGF